MPRRVRGGEGRAPGVPENPSLAAPGNPGCKPIVGAGREVSLFLCQPCASCLANLLVGFRCLNMNARGRNQS